MYDQGRVAQVEMGNVVEAGPEVVTIHKVNTVFTTLDLGTAVTLRSANPHVHGNHREMGISSRSSSKFDC